MTSKGHADFPPSAAPIRQCEAVEGQKQVTPKLARMKGAYGFDAPYLLPIPASLIVLNLLDAVIARSLWPLVPAAIIAARVGCGLHTLRRGKFFVWKTPALVLIHFSLPY